jgi:NAD(P)-dependent dehydrogenase (short-subunit alcohol dehydrogenase family)
VEIFLADLSVQAEIRRVAEALRARYERIDLLINNAGLVNLHRTVTADGLETVFAVNHLAYFLLTRLLLDRLIASAPARIVNVASDAHRWSDFDLTDLQHERHYRAMPAYGASKLGNLLFTRELARRLNGTGVTVNSLHPGSVATRLGQNNGRFARLIIAALKPFFRSPERGAETVLHLALSPEVEGVSGKYFYNCRPRQPARAAEDDAAAARLWELSSKLTGLPAALDLARP